jgi:outer membrane autotransporter protein
MASGGSGSAFTVSPGADQSGLLGGDGTILSARVEDGGIIDPGSAAGAVGTLTLSASTNNALRFDSGSAYVVELSNGTSDLITGTGKARIDGGLVEVGGVSGPIADGERFTILDMSDLAGVGTFDNADDRALDDFAFYDFSIVYEATSQGTVELVAESAFDSEASTPNERAVAGSLAGIGGSPAYDDVLAYLASVPSGDGGSALNSLSGEVYATNQVVSSWTGMAFSRALRDRGLALASGGPKVEASAYVGTDSAPAGAQAIHLLAADAPEEPVAFPRDVYSDPDRLGVWAGGFGGWQRIDSDGNAADAENWVGGFIGGAERQWQTRGGIGEIGVALGYSHGRTDVADRESGADNDAFHAGAYAGAAIGRLTLSGAFGFAHISSDVSRDLPGGLGTSTANVDSDVLSASAEAAYTMPLGAFGIGPVTAFDAAWVRQDRFAEDGGGAIALTGDSEDYAVYFPGIGARLSLLHTNGARMSMLDARALWRHRLGNGAPDQTMAFSGAPASEPFAVEGLQGAEDWVELGLGASIRIDDVTMRGRYDAELGDGSTTHSGSVSLTVSF